MRKLLQLTGESFNFKHLYRSNWQTSLNERNEMRIKCPCRQNADDGDDDDDGDENDIDKR